MARREDLRFARVALGQAFVTREQVKDGLRLREKMADLGIEPKTLAELLLEKRYMTAEQVEMVLKIIGQTPGARRIANFKIIRRISKGAMGTVYKAKQVLMDRVVALKVLSDRLAKDREFKNRFIREARACGMLKHPNIVQGIDVGEWEGLMYFAMEFVDGMTVHKVVKQDGKLAPGRALEIAYEVALALDHATKHGMVHRDVKPDNIMLTREGQAKLCDLGLVKHPGYSGDTEEGRSLGTPNYISPEQAKGETTVDVRSDIYSLGATLFHMATGDVPFRGTPAVVMTKHITERFPDPRQRVPTLPDTVANLILKMCAKRPEDRHSTPREVCDDIERIQAGDDPYGSWVSDETPAVSEDTQPIQPVRRRRRKRR